MSSVSGVLTAGDAANFLGTHVETIRRLARRGEIPAFKVGKDWRFRKELLVNWAEGQRCTAKQKKPYEILVMDDDESYCRVIVRLLSAWGLRARYVTSAIKGLLLLEDTRFDLIFLDLVMPEYNGVQILERLRQKFPYLPVVVLTGYPNSELLNRAMDFAPVMLLSKPVEVELLRRTVYSVCGEIKILEV